jgi:hypothetical protein
MVVKVKKGERKRKSFLIGRGSIQELKEVRILETPQGFMTKSLNGYLPTHPINREWPSFLKLE